AEALVDVAQVVEGVGQARVPLGGEGERLLGGLPLLRGHRLHSLGEELFTRLEPHLLHRFGDGGRRAGTGGGQRCGHAGDSDLAIAHVRLVGAYLAAALSMIRTPFFGAGASSISSSIGASSPSSPAWAC